MSATSYLGRFFRQNLGGTAHSQFVLSCLDLSNSPRAEPLDLLQAQPTQHPPSNPTVPSSLCGAAQADDESNESPQNTAFGGPRILSFFKHTALPTNCRSVQSLNPLWQSRLSGREEFSKEIPQLKEKTLTEDLSWTQLNHKLSVGEAGTQPFGYSAILDVEQQPCQPAVDSKLVESIKDNLAHFSVDKRLSQGYFNVSHSKDAVSGTSIAPAKGYNQPTQDGYEPNSLHFTNPPASTKRRRSTSGYSLFSPAASFGNALYLRSNYSNSFGCPKRRKSSKTFSSQAGIGYTPFAFSQKKPSYVCSRTRLLGEFLGLEPSRYRNWTKELHEIMSTPITERGDQLRKLSQDFVETASSIGKTIILERNLPTLEKSIQPLSGKGIAGGEKFLHNNIFFKYAIDAHNLFGNDHACAMKVAGHELKGHTSLVACGMMAGLSFGMMCLIDFRGYRLLCTSQLPISQDTLVYGSMDGGNTVLNESAAMSEKLQHCGEILNLKPHIAGLQSPQLMHGPCDIEGHIGKDGNYYVIDLARLWPPRTPRPDLPGSFLYRLLRSEFVTRYKLPLSSDAFSLFGADHSEQHNREVEEATSYLEEVVVPQFASMLEELPPNCPFHADDQSSLSWLIQEGHRFGINTYYLGRIRSHVTNEAVRRKLLTEMVSRVFKQELYKRMRLLDSSDDREFNTLIVDFFNLVFGSSKSSKMFWSSDIHTLLRCKYDEYYLGQAEQQSNDLRQYVRMDLLFYRLQSLTGICFSGFELPFSNGVLQSVNVKAKHMYMIDRIEGDTAASLARTAGGDEAKRLLLFAKERYNDALNSKPDDSSVLMNLGFVYNELSKFSESEPERKEYWQLSFHNFELAMQLSPSDIKVYLLWGNAIGDRLRIVMRNEVSEGREHHLNGDSLQPNTLFDLACEKYSVAYGLQRDNFNLLFNWACLHGCFGLFLFPSEPSRALTLLRRARDLYIECLQVRYDKDALVNLGTLLVRCSKLISNAKDKRQMLKEARIHFQKAEDLEEGVASYNMACVYSLLRNFEACAEWLIRCHQYNRLPPIEFISRDNDLEQFCAHVLQHATTCRDEFRTDAFQGAEWIVPLVERISLCK